MSFKFDHDYHIHSKVSLCSNDEGQTNERILQYAKDSGLSEIILTDHFWDEKSIAPTTDFYIKQDLAHIKQALPLPQAEGVRFLFGAEVELDKNCTVPMTKETYDELAFVIIPTTHLHMRGLTITEADYDAEDDTRSRLWVSRMDALLSQDLPFHKIGIAHLACPLFDKRSREHYLRALDNIPTEDMERIFAKAAELGVGIELNAGDLSFRDSEENTVLRMFRIAKAQGCKFYCGSDAHHPNALERARSIYERALPRLDLSENDRFYIGE